VPNQLRAKNIALSLMLSCLMTGGPALAQINTTSTLPDSDGIKTTGLKPDEINQSKLAQSTGAGDITAVAAVASATGKKHKGELLITDSLWGNLILDLAYQRDDRLHCLAKRMGFVNAATILGITGIAGGTLAQGIIALSVLNPPPPQSDSYLPGSIGIGMSGLTLIALGARTGASRIILKQIRTRQLEIKHRVESVLAQIEQSNGQSTTARSQLLSLIGERATNEWLQLWRSSNKLAMSGEPTDNPPPKVSFSESVLKQSLKLSSSDL
jgi:hypothetical protein